MKITRNMIYRPSDAATELTLFAVNEHSEYERFLGVISSLSRKMRKGIYDPQKAVISYYHAVTQAAKVYDVMYGNPFQRSTFNVTDRWTAATDLEEYFRENVEELATA